MSMARELKASGDHYSWRNVQEELGGRSSQGKSAKNQMAGVSNDLTFVFAGTGKGSN